MNRAMFLKETLPARSLADDAPLVILGYEVDKSDPEELYAALCWIESTLNQLHRHHLERLRSELAVMRERFLCTMIIAFALAGLGIVGLLSA